MSVKTSKRMMSLILLATALLCGVVVTGSQVAVFGVGQATSPVQKANKPQAAPALAQSNAGELILSDQLSKLLVHKVAPIYPERGIKARVQCKVELNATVNEEGLVSDVQVTKGHPLFDDAASAAVKQWKFHPSVVGGSAANGPVPPPPLPKLGIKGVPFTITITIEFNLGKNEAQNFVASASDYKLLLDHK